MVDLWSLNAGKILWDFIDQESFSIAGKWGLDKTAPYIALALASSLEMVKPHERGPSLDLKFPGAGNPGIGHFSAVIVISPFLSATPVNAIVLGNTPSAVIFLTSSAVVPNQKICF